MSYSKCVSITRPTVLTFSLSVRIPCLRATGAHTSQSKTKFFFVATTLSLSLSLSLESCFLVTLLSNHFDQYFPSFSLKFLSQKAPSFSLQLYSLALVRHTVSFSFFYFLAVASLSTHTHTHTHTLSVLLSHSLPISLSLLDTKRRII